MFAIEQRIIFAGHILFLLGSGTLVCCLYALRQYCGQSECSNNQSVLNTASFTEEENESTGTRRFRPSKASCSHGYSHQISQRQVASRQMVLRCLETVKRMLLLVGNSLKLIRPFFLKAKRVRGRRCRPFHTLHYRGVRSADRPRKHQR